ncbi:MAG: hypothetical protein GC129_03855 [Proteobacteria bacterium]|nr:hypothetical protein [Pseudomonadota bacterium]
MATPHDPTAAFLREVDEALQYDHIMSLWHRYKWLLLAAVIVLLLAVAGSEGYKAWRQHQARAQATRYYAITALNASPARARQLTQFTASAHGGYKALAAFAQAQAAATPQARAAAYQLVAQDSSLPAWLQQMARFNMALAQLGTNNAAAQTNLELLTQQGLESSPLYPAALEQLSILAMAKGDTVAARGYTEKLLAAPLVAADMRQRALQRLGALSTLPR